MWGGSLRQDQVASDPFFGDRGRQHIDVKRLFLNTEWRVGSPLLLHVGTMVEDHEFTGTDSSPRIAISYSPVSDHTLRVSYSEPTRTPTAFEQRSNATVCFDPGCTAFDDIYLSSGGLDPEHIEATELAYVGRIQKDTIVDFRVYKNRITDIISSFDVPTVDNVDNELQDFANIYDVDVTGGQVVERDELGRAARERARVERGTQSMPRSSSRMEPRIRSEA